MIFEIKSGIGLEEVEAKYEFLNRCMATEVSVDLLLPKHLTKNYFGLVPSLFQLASTWARHPNSGHILLPVDDPENTEWEDLYDNELLFPLIAFAWNSHGIFNKDGQINLRRYLKDFNSEVFDKMLKIRALKGDKLLLTEFDHLPNDRGILPCFEVGGKFIDDPITLGKNLAPGLKEVLSFSHKVETGFEAIAEDSVKIVLELMKNTWEWAREDADGVALDPNLRGVIIRFWKKRRNTLVKDLGNNPGLVEYFKSPELKENSLGEIYFLEISVFDSGIGFVDRYQTAVPEAAGLTSVEVVKECLVKHKTTAVGLEKDDKGQGLDRILSTLDGKGFLRIRTADVSVYRNMIAHRYDLGEKGDLLKFGLFDWTTHDDKDFHSYVPANGSLITIVYPFSINPPL